jgi:hypothetical protein
LRIACGHHANDQMKISASFCWSAPISSRPGCGSSRQPKYANDSAA